MKHYLVRSGFNPICVGDNKGVDPELYLWRSYVGENAGNMMFAYGVMNTLMTGNTKLSFTYGWEFSEKEIAKINEEYDAFIVPMADAFRPRFTRQLTGYTHFFQKLKIPVIITGIGLRADYEPDFSKGFPFDEEVKAFCKAVLDKSSVIGVRGQITADYLKHLGFREETDYTPIGCPSLYTYGTAVSTKSVPDTINNLVMNQNGYYNIGNVNEFLLNTAKKAKSLYLVQQIQNEFRDMYLGQARYFSLRKGGKKSDWQEKMLFKGEFLDELYRLDRVRYFFDVPSWLNFMRSFDLFVGNRFHGAVSAILTGVPHIMVPFNARTREMVEYHSITNLKPDEICEGTSALDYLDRLDFQSFFKNQKHNLDHYKVFLSRNGLEHIFSEKDSYGYGESPMEQMISKTLNSQMDQWCNIAHSYLSLSEGEKKKRLCSCYGKQFLATWEEVSERVSLGRKIVEIK